MRPAPLQGEVDRLEIRRLLRLCLGHA
jgi:hypothetical protein